MMPAKRDKIEIVAACVMVGAVCLVLVFWAGVGYIALHFIAKFW